MITYKIWNKKDTIIKGVSNDYIIESNKILKDDEVFLIVDQYGNVKQIEIVRVIKGVYGLNPNLTATETAIAYLNIQSDNNPEVNKPSILEEHSKKIDSLEAEIANSLLDSTNKDIKLKSLEKDLAELTLIVGGM